MPLIDGNVLLAGVAIITWAAMLWHGKHQTEKDDHPW